MFGEGLELQRVKRVLSASDVLHGVFSSAALAEETGQRGGTRGGDRMRVKKKSRSDGVNDVEKMNPK